MRRMTTLWSLFAALSLTAGFPALAEEGAGSDLDAARQLYMEADFEAAQPAFEALLAHEGVDDATALEAHRYLAALSLIVEDRAAARAHANEAVALDPDVTAPEGAPPELERVLDGAREARAAEREPEPEPAPGPEGPGFTTRWVTLAPRVGVYVPTIVNQMLPHVTVGLQVGVLLPFHDRRLSVVVGGAYSPPWVSGEGNDPRLGDSGSEWTFDMRTHEVFLSLGLVYRFFAPGTAVAVPYVGLEGRLYLLHTTVDGEGGGAEFGENTEQSTQGGGAVVFGVELPMGPGAFLIELSFGISALPHTITGETTTGSLALDLGYRLFL